MTDWRRSFRAELFRAWRDAGLPDPGRYERTYDAVRAQAVPPEVAAHHASAPLVPDTLRSVHGFGHAVGTVCADLLDVRGDARDTSVSWCGRFNLGVSLVDWLCDEAKVTPDELAGLPAFAPLVGRAAAAPASNESAAFLDRLAGDLLRELAHDIGPPRPGEARSGVWPSLRRMLRAEIAAAQPGFFDPAQPLDVLPALRLKSVEPFRIMAERTVLAERLPEQARRATTTSRQVGRAIGECVWLADDADDLWRDLDAGSGNRFVAAAAAADPRVLSADRRTVVDIAVVRVLRRERVAERLCARAVRRLVAALRVTPCDQQSRERSAGLVGVALARWAT